MALFQSGFSALGKLLTVALLALSFLFGLGGVLFVSLQGEEVEVPEIVGKNFNDGEDELASLGLRIKRRADRYSQEPPDTVLEQLPKPGETVKTGQMVLVVTSKPNPEGGEAPATINKGDEKGDSERIEEMISEKPKRKNANSNANANSAQKKPDANTAQPEGGDKAPEGGDADAKKNANTGSGDVKKDPKPAPSPTRPAPSNPQGARPAAESRPRRTVPQE